MSVLSLLAPGTARAAAPVDFELYDLSDRLVRLETVRKRARLVVVDFFAHSCKPCRKALPALKRIHSRYSARGVVVIVVALPDEGSERDQAHHQMQRFFKRRAEPYTVVWDKYGLVARRYGVLKRGTLKLPRMFLVSREGRVVHRGTEPQSVEAAIRRHLPVEKRPH